jgi:hypothetical protein
MSGSAFFRPGTAPIAEAPPPGMPMPVQGMAAPPSGIAAGVPPEMKAEVDRIRQSQVVPDPAGGIMLQHPDDAQAAERPPTEQVPHGANLAEYLWDDQDLTGIGREVLEGIDADLESNTEFFAAIEAGLELLPLKIERRDDPFDNASGAVHPMMLNALMRFVANAHAEMLPSSGPARCITMATPSQPVQPMAERKVQYLNYYLTTLDRDYYSDCDAGHLKLGLYGSIFRKVYGDPITGLPRSRHLSPTELLVSYHAPNLEGALRATHIEALSTNEAMRRRLSGYYLRDAEFLDAGAEDDVPAARARDNVDQRKPSDRQEDSEQVHMHCHCLLDLPGFEHLDPETDEPSGLPLPYIVTVDRRTEKVLRIERDWDEEDGIDGTGFYARRDTYSHFKLHPGLGFYGWGLLVLMGSLTDTASTLWRQAINAHTLHSFPGGFRAKGMRMEEENLTVGPGEFPEIDTGGLPISEAIMPLPYRDVPASFPPLFGTVIEAGQSIGQTQELQVGEGRSDAPTGTTLALIEQAMRPTAAMFRRMHTAQGQELRMVAKRFALNKEAVYPYFVDGKPGQSMAADFATVNDIVPVSDPNVPTQTQRLAMAQMTLSLAQSSNGVIDMKAVYSRMLTTMGYTSVDIAQLMPPPNQGQPADVATETANVLKGLPLAVGDEQDHLSHLRVHLAFLMTPGLPPVISSSMLAHCADHVGKWYRLQVEMVCKQAGIELPPPGQPMPPELDAASALAVAAVADHLTDKLAAVLASAGPQSDPSRMAQVELKRQELAFKIDDAARKAQTTGRQDQTELLKVREQLDDQREDRSSAQGLAKLDLVAELVRAGSQAHKSAAVVKAAELKLEAAKVQADAVRNRPAPKPAAT